MFEGWFGERKTQFNLWFSLNKELYHRFHDIIIPSDNGTTQVDHVLVSPFGLFIVETKNLKGWIFGSEEKPKWTQVVYKNKYSFEYLSMGMSSDYKIAIKCNSNIIRLGSNIFGKRN